MSKLNGMIQLDTKNIYCLPIPGGYLDIRASSDPDYPGLDIEFFSDNKTDDENAVSRPRVLIEKPYNEENETFDKLRALCWSDMYQEDYTSEIELE